MSPVVAALVRKRFRSDRRACDAPRFEGAAIATEGVAETEGAGGMEGAGGAEGVPGTERVAEAELDSMALSVG